MPTNYTSRDFSSVKSDLVARAKASIPEWSRAQSSDFAMTLIDLWAYVADIQNYYLDRAHNEAFMATATQRASVHALAQAMGYTPNPRTSATATVTVANGSASGTADITLPKGTMFNVPATSSTGVIYFTSTAAATISAGSSATISLLEGRQVTETLTTNFSGRAASSFVLSEQKVVPASLSLKVGTATYNYHPRLPDASASAPVFTTVTDSSDNTVVVLGNGVNGLVPPTGVTITASYRVGQGPLGNVSANAITLMDSPVTGISISSSTSGAGGGDPESLASIKLNAPTLRRTQNRAVTLNDYISVIRGYSGVSKAHALSTTSSGAVTINYTALPSFDDYDLRGLPTAEGGSNLGTALSLTSDFGSAGTDINSNLSDYLSDRSMVGVQVNQISTTVNVVDVYVGFSRVEIRDGYQQTEVQQGVKDAVRALFTWDNIKFDQTVRLADITSAALAVPGVLSVTVSNISGSSSGTSAADFAITATTSSAVYLPTLRGVAVSGMTGGVS